MSIVLDFEPETEAALQSLARARGLSVAEFLHSVVDRELKRPAADVRPGAEKAEAFSRWADSFPEVPPLSDADLSRESLYPDRQ